MKSIIILDTKYTNIFCNQTADPIFIVRLYLFRLFMYSYPEASVCLNCHTQYTVTIMLVALTPAVNTRLMRCYSIENIMIIKFKNIPFKPPPQAHSLHLIFPLCGIDGTHFSTFPSAVAVIMMMLCVKANTFHWRRTRKNTTTWGHWVDWCGELGFEESEGLEAEDDR